MIRMSWQSIFVLNDDNRVNSDLHYDLCFHQCQHRRSHLLSVPVAPTQGYSKEKAKLSMKKPAQKWQWRQFDNPSRTVCPLVMGLLLLVSGLVIIMA